MTDERIEQAVKKVKEAVEFFKKRNSYIDGVDDLVSLAESYLKAGNEWPEKVEEHDKNCGCGCHYLRVWNYAVKECRLVATRLLAEKDAEIERLRDMIKEMNGETDHIRKPSTDWK